MRDLLTDLKLAVRTWARAPVTTLVIVLTLALGIGANGAIFSVLHGVILQPLDYPESQRLVMGTSQFPGLGFDRFWISPPEYLEYREWNESFEEMGAYRTTDVSIVGGDQPLRVRAAVATASLFDTLAVEPLLGRTYTAQEDVENGPDVAVLSWELWQRAFGGDEALVGERLEVNGRPTTVVGVMPPGFDVEESGVEAWLPTQLAENPTNRGSHYLYLVGRLKPEVGLEAARSELDLLVAGWEERVGNTHAPNPEHHRLQLAPLHEEVVGDTRPALLALLGAVGFLLLIACANVANILLARSEVRQQEMAVRTAMGASRGRLIGQLLTESVLLALVGGALGVALAHWGLRALLAVNPESLPRTDEVVLDGTVIAVSVGIALLTGLVFGLVPALRLSAARVGGLLKEGAGRSSGGRSALRGRSLLVVGEIALAVGLVVASGLMIRSVRALLDQDAGFDATNLMTFQLYLPESSYAEGGDQVAFFDRLLDSIREVPGVESAAGVSGLPPSRPVNANDMEFEGIERTEDGPPHNIDYWQFIADDYLEALDVRIVDGRGFLPSDDRVPVALVNEKAAQTWWPDQSAVGRRLRPGWGDYPWITIVGVVEDVKQQGLDGEVGTEVYWKFDQVAALGQAPRTMNVVVRSSLPEGTMAPMLREKVWALDPSLPVASLRSMEEVVSRSVSRPRLLALLLTIFASVALFLAAIGIYGVLSYAVAQRGQELGIRMALGADRGTILRMVLGQGALVAVLGLTLGVLLSLTLSRVIGSLLWGVSPTDPATYVAVVALLGVVALVACALPALRATRVDPMSALRYE